METEDILFEEKLEEREDNNLNSEGSISCKKCGHHKTEKEKFGKPLCDFCYHFAPSLENEFRQYISETANGRYLKPFRRYLKNTGVPQKKGMISKAKEGNSMSRAPFGYSYNGKDLVPKENYLEVEEIFEEFLTNNISLNRLSKKHSLSVNGLKKILTNFTYVGKIKFDGEIHEGKHKPIVSTTLFNHVQNKLERLGIKKISGNNKIQNT